MCFSEAPVWKPMEASSSKSVTGLETFYPKNLNGVLYMEFCFQVIK